MDWKVNNAADAEKKHMEIGRVDDYEVFPGIQIFYDSLPERKERMTRGSSQLDRLEIIHCRGGEAECTCCDGDHPCIEKGRVLLRRWKKGNVRSVWKKFPAVVVMIVSFR